MSILVGKKAPDFKAEAVFEEEIKEISLSDYKGRYIILFFYPLDFTFVCPTELLSFQQNLKQFEDLGVSVLGCSVDSVYTHRAWLQTPIKKGGIQGVSYGLISDLGGEITQAYGILHEKHVAYRGLFLIDCSGVVRHQVINDLTLGRSVKEALRMVEALKHFEECGEVCPADWHKNTSAISQTQEGIEKYLTEKFDKT